MYNIAIIGYGIVGSGVARVLAANRGIINKRAGDEINIKYILDVRNFPGDTYADRIIHDINTILNDPSVKIVVETIGGVRHARDFTEKALRAKKHVVTSNKELVAGFGDILLKVAAENGVRYMFEASVGGGIPLLTPLAESLAANEIDEIDGIVNGTTNYILTEMKKGKTLEGALSEARKHGYAEANPADDLNGADACRKLCILTAVAFGVLFEPEKVLTRGIERLTAADILQAEESGRSIKLIARAKKRSDGRFSLCVAPFAVNNANPLAGVEGVYNAVLIRGNAVGDVMFYGRGAGSMPTASSVIADIIYIVSRSQYMEKSFTAGVWIRDPALLASEDDQEKYLEMRELLGEPVFSLAARI